jgi:transcription-repair coupling factor (superfamily II helicase)
MNPWQYLEQILAGRIAPGLRLGGCVPSLRPLAAAVLREHLEGFPVFVLPDNEAAERFAVETGWHLAAAGRPPGEIPVLPALEVEPYRGISPHPRILAQRSLALWRLLDGSAGGLVVTADAWLGRLPVPDEWIGRLVELRLAREYPLEELRRRLADGGYKREDPVTEPGEFSVRGGVLDVFSPNLPHPLRVEYFGDFVDSIRTFDPDTQRSVASLEAATIIPMTPYPGGAGLLKSLAGEIPRRFPGEDFAASRGELLAMLEAGASPPGVEFLAPLTAPQAGALWDYLGRPFRVIDLTGGFAGRLDDLAAVHRQAFEESQGAGRIGLPPEAHFHPAATAAGALAESPPLVFEDFPSEGPDRVLLHSTATSSFLGNFSGLIRHLAATHEHVLFVLSSPGRCERIHDLCQEYGIDHAWKAGARWDDLELGKARRILIAQGPLERGFRLPELSLAVLGSDDIFPRTKRRPQEPQASRYRSVTAFFSDFKDLKPGDYIVHLDHGVGIFRGLERLHVGGADQEFAQLEYADKARLYVPAERLDLVQKYAGGEAFSPPLERLGTATWQKTRARVKKSIQDMARELLQLYARRASVTGITHPPDDHWQREFESMFEYEETPDQLRAIAEIKSDLQSPRPMDRLLCGDVGYGKTEVAMRAAFKAVSGGRQVAILAPTTVLAFQHYHTFRSRFASFPFQIDLLSRFRNPREQKATLQNLAEGRVDILVGTHRLLSKDVAFRNLGLLVVDEEQRFGVTHKERIKKMRADIDVLTMTATPIPRTLYMSVMGIRDISVIETPPKDRLSIQTQVVRFDDGVIREAVRHELARSGQVYFVYNRVETIFTMAARLRELVPEARLAVAHGQMRESELEKILLEFIAHEHDVLLSTTIIENGIDIPLVNTILVHHAHRFGLAQLYQLRGRVGRSSRRAHAWLMVPSLEELSPVARKRLAAIRDFTELGAGFRLAALDLEIRGAGNILGAEQHGHINAVGFEMYCRLMEETVKETRGEKYLPPEKIQLNLHVKLRIPIRYIPEEEERLHLYKKIASATDEGDLMDLREEIRDRYGVFPEVMEYLFEYVRLKLLAQRLRISSVDRKQDVFRIQLSEESDIDPEALVRKIQAGESMTFSPDGLLTIRLPHASIPEMFQHLKSTLLELSPHATI